MLSFGRQLTVNVVLEARIPARITTKSALLEVLGKALKLPDYFGNNWDALEECIRDFSWLPQGNITLIHEDLPLTDDEPSLATYLTILSAADAMWRDSGKREFLVIFPESARERVQSIALSERLT